MNITQEIIELQKQIDFLKKKQELSKFWPELYIGQLFTHHTNNPDYSVIIFNINTKWGYMYSDGSGMFFNSKQELEKHLSDNDFVYYCGRTNFIG